MGGNIMGEERVLGNGFWEQVRGWGEHTMRKKVKAWQSAQMSEPTQRIVLVEIPRRVGSGSLISLGLGVPSNDNGSGSWRLKISSTSAINPISSINSETKAD